MTPFLIQVGMSIRILKIIESLIYPQDVYNKGKISLTHFKQNKMSKY